MWKGRVINVIEIKSGLREGGGGIWERVKLNAKHRKTFTQCIKYSYKYYKAAATVYGNIDISK